MEYEDIDSQVYEKEIKSFLPKRILDFHSHIFLRNHLSASFFKEKLSPCLPMVVEEYPIEALLATVKKIFPRQEYSALLFPLPDPKGDMERANRYVTKVVQKYNFNGLMIPSLKDSAQVLSEKIERGKFLGFKPYWTFVTAKRQDEVRIEDMVTEAQMEVANDKGLIIMLHIPRKDRLADPENIQGIRTLCKKCPKGKVVLAHIGRSYMLSSMVRFGETKDLPNLYIDFSAVQNWEVFELLLRNYNRKKILFGLDLPITQIKGKMIIVNEQRHFFTKRSYPWGVSNRGNAYPIRCTLMAYEIIREFKKAAGKVNLTSKEAEDIFYYNGMDLIQNR